MDDVLRDIYYDVQHPAGFSGVQALYKAAQKQTKKPITLNQVKAWLQEQKTYTLHKPIRRRFNRRKTVVGGIDYQWQADLADLQSLMKDNDQYRYLLCVIDVFSRYAWVIPLYNKTGQSLIQAFKVIFQDGRKPKALQTDKGTEFKNRDFQSFLKKENVHFFTTENPETKASVAERFQRTLKTRMWKYFTHHKTRRYLDVLKDLVRSYNHRTHRSIQTSPAQVTPKNEPEIARRLYGSRTKKARLPVKVGDLVRINKTKKTFEKGYLPNWTLELFKIIHIRRTSPPTVQLEDLAGERIKGSFYLPEIQPIKDTEVYQIESVLGRRSRKVDGKTIKEIKVHWEGYPKKFDSWIPESYLI